jgi:hypothetical protein
MNGGDRFHLICMLGIILLWTAGPVGAGYKSRTWSMGARDSYPARLTSEGVTIAVEPLFTDALAARVFGKDDIVTRGIMPLAILIFNDNAFPVEVDGLSIELVHENDHIRTLTPNEVVCRLFRRDKSWVSQPIPKAGRPDLNKDAMNDFDQKFLMSKMVAPHDQGSGFLYLHVTGSESLDSYLSNAIVYIPNVYRQDNGSRLIYFEIALKAAINAPRRG